MNNKKKLTAALVLMAFGVSVQAGVITFDDLAHGEVVFDQYDGVTISADNASRRRPDTAITYNTVVSPVGADPDLQPPWADGNYADYGLDKNTDLGNVLIIAENTVDTDPADGLIDDPDDERRGGVITFEFDEDITEFGFDLVDVDGPNEYGNNAGYVMSFYDGMTELGTLGFGDLIARDNADYGNNSYNRISPVTTQDFNPGAGVSGFNVVKVSFGGSGGIDNVHASVPEPGMLLTMGFGLLTLAGLSVRRKKNS